MFWVYIKINKSRHNLVLKGPPDGREMKMSATSFFVVCLIALKQSIYAGTGSQVSSSCSLKCDLVQEVTLLRQLVNQENLLRIGLETQLQELRTAFSDDLAKVKTSIRRSKNTIQGLEQAVENGNKDTKQKFQALERDVTSLNQTFRAQSMYHCLWYIYIHTK